MKSQMESEPKTEDQRRVIAQLVAACGALLTAAASLDGETEIRDGIRDELSKAALQARSAVDRAKHLWGGTKVTWYPDLLDAAQAVVEILGEEDLPDNGELSGAAISDMLRAAVETALGNVGETEAN
jgi:hypothetical protein